MERVAFLIEKTGERLACLLNPETVTIRRIAGVRPRDSVSGPLRGAGLTDDPMIYIGGGLTELTLDLLFDTTLGEANNEIEDVRRLTKPFVDLAENSEDQEGRGEPRIIRFVWGKAWNIPGVVAATSERLEYFTQDGIPRRSWLRMRMLRVNPPEPPQRPAADVADLKDLLPSLQPENLPAGGPPPAERAVEVTGGPHESEGPTQSAPPPPVPTRVDELAYQYLGDASLWRLIAWFNNIADPLHVPAGTLLSIPPLAPGATST